MAVVISAVATGLVWRGVFVLGSKKTWPMRLIIYLIFVAALPIDGLFTALTPLWVLVGKAWSSLLPLLALAWALNRAESYLGGIGRTVPAAPEAAAHHRRRFQQSAPRLSRHL